MPAELRAGPEYLLAALTRQKIFWFIIFHRGAGILPALPALSISSLSQLGKAAGAKAQVMAVESLMSVGLQGR